MNVLETAGLDISNHIIMIVGHIKSVLFAFHILDKNKYFFFRFTFSVYRLCNNYSGCWAGYRGVYCSGTKKCKFPTNTENTFTGMVLYYPSKARHKELSYIYYKNKWIPFSYKLLCKLVTLSVLCINNIHFITLFLTTLVLYDVWK